MKKFNEETYIFPIEQHSNMNHLTEAFLKNIELSPQADPDLHIERIESNTAMIGLSIAIISGIALLATSFVMLF